MSQGRQTKEERNSPKGHLVAVIHVATARITTLPGGMVLARPETIVVVAITSVLYTEALATVGMRKAERVAREAAVATAAREAQGAMVAVPVRVLKHMPRSIP